VSERQRVDDLSFVRMALGFESPSSFKKTVKGQKEKAPFGIVDWVLFH